MQKLSRSMRRKLITILALLAVISLSGTSAFASSPHFSGDTLFSLGSLIGDGTLVGLGNQDVTAVLDATGVPVVTCTNQGGNQVPGQSPSKVEAQGTQFLDHTTYTKNGTSPFHVETQPPLLSAEQLGCPNNTWKAIIVFVYWTDALITVQDAITGVDLLDQRFSCVTTRNPDSVVCTPIP